MQDPHVILVNEQNQPIGSMPKLEAHLQGLLHRAFSICIFNSKGEILLQKRAKNKYHSPSLWTNTCCSHQILSLSDENVISERLFYEMGFVTKVSHAFDLRYRAEFPNGLIENEYDLVYVGVFDGVPKPNPLEVEAYQWMDYLNLIAEIRANPNNFTPWFLLMVNDLKPYFK